MGPFPPLQHNIRKPLVYYILRWEKMGYFTQQHTTHIMIIEILQLTYLEKKMCDNDLVV